METFDNATVIVATDTEVRDSLIRESTNYLVQVCHGQSVSSGWWTHPATGMDLKKLVQAPDGAWHEYVAGALVAQKLCLVHSEISEAMEGARKKIMDDKIPSRTMLEVELADAVIRITDLAGALDLDLAGAVAEKLAFNRQREDHKLENRVKEGGKAY